MDRGEGESGLTFIAAVKETLASVTLVSLLATVII